MRYRRDIDGLRAIAVVAVVLFHIDSALLPGGFLGVDAFFVVSGYLITGIIDRERDGGFRLLDFYRRRVVRVLPALLTVVLATCLVGAAVLLPVELRALGSSAAAAALFASNVFFWKEASYFGGMAEGRPLLHTWSLGVEEQFYLLYPLLLPSLLRRAGRQGALAGLAVVALLSLGLTLAFWRSNPVPVFYLLPPRAWEIGLGAMVALAPARHGWPAATRQALAGAGLAAIVLALAMAVPDGTFQPGWAAALCAGTALLLRCGEETMVGRALSVRPVRYLGLLSYSLYLVHWPILSLYRITHAYDLAVGEAVMLAGCSLAAAVVLHHGIEQPCRRRFRAGAPLPVVAVGLVTSLAVAASALALGRVADRLRPIPPEVRRVEAYADYWRRPFRPVAVRHPCPPGSAARPRMSCPAAADLVLVGDSHAGHIGRALALRFPAYRLIFRHIQPCRWDETSAAARRCAFERAWRPLLDSPRTRVVVLAARWHDVDTGFLPAMIRDIRRRHIDVLVVGPVVEYDGSVPALLARALWTGDYREVERARRLDRARLDRAMEPVVRGAGAAYFSPYRRECPDGRCRHFSSRREPIHFDYGHYTFSASVDIIAGLAAL